MLQLRRCDHRPLLAGGHSGQCLSFPQDPVEAQPTEAAALPEVLELLKAGERVPFTSLGLNALRS